MHYTQRHLDRSPVICLPEEDDSISTIPTSSTVQWLGVYFDWKLLFNKHVTKIASRAEATIANMSMLANTTQGLSHYYLQQLYKTYNIIYISSIVDR